MRNFKTRNFVSLFIAWTGLVSIISGIILYFAPAGRVAFWVDWHFWGLTKKQWQATHTVSSFFLMIFIIWHLILNWKVFVNYMKDKAKKISFTVPELSSSILIAIVLTVMSIYSIPPVSYIMDFGDYLTASWETKTTSPIIPHAERLTLEEFCAKINLPVERAIRRLTAYNVKNVSADKTLEEIAKKNNLAPKDIADILNFQKQFKETSPIPVEENKNNEYDTDKTSQSAVRGRYGQAKGQPSNFNGLMYIGKMTLKEFCEKTGIDILKAKSLLKSRGFGDVDENAVLRDIARGNGLMPRELGEMIYSLKEKKTE